MSTYICICVQMSVISSRSIIAFKAPVTMGPSTVSMVGSWQMYSSNTLREYRFSPEYLAHVRLATWKHTIQETPVQTSLDWTARNENNEVLYTANLIFETTAVVTLEDLVGINTRVQTLLNKNKFILDLQKRFQQEHPGDWTVDGTEGSAGKDGESQSD